MDNKLIYIEEHLQPYKSDTVVELIGEGHYAISQWRGDKKSVSLVYLTRHQIEQILKEQEVSK